MKLIKRKILFTTFLLVSCSMITVATNKKDKTVTLPNGKILINPYVITEHPDGLEVGHNNGIIQLKFKDLPKKIQKKYNYSPKKALAYEKKKAIKRKENQKRMAKQEQNKKIQDEKFRRYRRDASLETLQIDIKKCENRIAFLKTEIPKLESNQKSLLNKTTSMATTSVSGNNSGRGGYSSWEGGYSYSTGSNRSGNRAERTKDRQIRKLDDEYATAKHRLRTYQKELSTKEIDLIKLNNRLTKIKKQKSTEASLPTKKK